jgi:hypothetical protein
MNVPDWLTKRDGAIKSGLSASTWLVLIDGHPQYRLVATPAAGKFICAITQTNNGRRLEGTNTWASTGEALQGGLEELRSKLGW